MTKQEIRDIVTAMGAYTELTGLVWDGSNKYKTSLSGNLALSLNSTKVAGMLVIEDNNSYTLTINGTSVPINATTPTVIGFTKANGIYYVIDKDGLTVQVAAPDVTAPTVSSATATNANTIQIVFSETMGSVTIAGHSFKQNGTPITPDSVTGSGTTWNFVVSETLLNTDTLLRSYDSTTGATTDVANNELVSYTDQSVTNGIAADFRLHDEFTDTNGVQLSAHTIAPRNVPVASWSTPGGAATYVINANKLECAVESTGNAVKTAVLESGVADGVIRATVSRTGNSDIAVMFRYVDENNYWIADLTAAGAFAIFELTAGTYTQRATIAKTFNTSTDYVIEVTLVGNLITATVDGGSTITHTSAVRNTATKHGIWISASFVDGIGGVPKIDNFIIE